jgi:hypothetical protein
MRSKQHGLKSVPLVILKLRTEVREEVELHHESERESSQEKPR